VLWAPIVLTPFTISNFRDVHTIGRYLYESTAVIAVLAAVLAVRAVRWKPIIQWPALCAGFIVLGYFAASIPRIVP
jgi:hypothetical protein